MRPWGYQRAVDYQTTLARTHEKFIDERWALPATQRCGEQHAPSQRPRIYVYELPPHLLPPPSGWRHVRAIKAWIEASRFYERNPFCADYFLVPSHAANRIPRDDGEKGHWDVGDYRVAAAFAYLRDRFPFWNRTVRLAQPRHLMLLPCDHGPGDCAYSRPNLPYKYAPRAAADASGTPWWKFLPRAYRRDEIERMWGEGWELLNPASPARLVVFLTCAPPHAVPARRPHDARTTPARRPHVTRT